MSFLSDTWLTGEEAAAVISAVSGRPISKAYVQLLGRRNQIRMQKLSQHTSFYHCDDCRTYVVKKQPGNPGGRPRKQAS